MNKPLILALLLSALPFSAQAKRQQNLSMPPDEMIRQGVQNNTQVQQQPMPGNNMVPSYPTQGGYPAQRSYAQPITAQPVVPSSNYMDGYCDPNFKPLLSRNAQYANIANCLEQQKTQACELYRNMPADAKKAVDDTMNCLAQGQSGGGLVEAPDGTLQPAAPSNGQQDCGYTDTNRLTMVKRYWQDQNVAYAIIFVPELAMDNSGACLGGR
ncbi:MAG: hypothetical protein EBX37_18335 [Alphaproteobacteria bacterium]|nr:hypothetical protein [Alphaproteobacteria bacterium]